jgi:hypothetical protein
MGTVIGVGAMVDKELAGENQRNLENILLHCCFTINLLAPKFYFAYPVYKMQKYRTKKR